MTAAVVLAAGGSSRMGRPKPLLTHRGRSLLRRAVDAAAAAGCAPVVAVLGAALDEVRPELTGLPVEVAINDRWREGLAGSIRTGIEALRARHPGVDAVVLIPCDLPNLDEPLIRKLLEAASRGGPEPIVACEYAGTVGVPALFHRRWFDELRALRGDRGAKPLLLAHADATIGVPWAGGALDVDDPADRDRLDDPSP